MRWASVAISILLMSTLIQWTPNVNAQSSDSGITLACDSIVEIDVTPGEAQPGIANCQLSNPTDYEETVQITIDTQGRPIDASAPEIVTVQGGEVVSFEAIFTAAEGGTSDSGVDSINAEVTQLNGSDCSDCAESTATLSVIIKQYGKIRIEATENLVTLGVDETRIIEFKVYNDGNGYDRLNLEVENRIALSYVGIGISLPSISVEIDRNAPPKTMRVLVTATNQMCEEDGFSDQDREYVSQIQDSSGDIFLNISITSEASVQSGSSLVRQNVSILLHMVDWLPAASCEEEGALPGPSLPFIFLTILIASLRSRRNYC